MLSKLPDLVNASRFKIFTFTCRYALGGFDGNTMIPSVEIFDPRLETWMVGEPMNHPRGYSAASVVNDSIYMIGGVKFGEEILDNVSVTVILLSCF